MRIHILDYAALTGDAGSQGASRAIAPQSAYAKLSRYDGVSWITVQQLSVSADNLTYPTVQGSETVLPVARTGTLVFSGIPVGTYSPGALKIDLSETPTGAVLSSGMNTVDVIVTKDASAVFRLTPQNASVITNSSLQGSVSTGKMVFYRFDLQASDDLYISASKTGGTGEPDVYLFNGDGVLFSFDDFIAPGPLVISVPVASDSASSAYIGMYADGGDVQFEITHSSTIPVGPGPTGRGEGSIAAPIELVPGTAKAASIVFDDDDYNTDDYSYYTFNVAAAGKYVVSASSLAGPADPYAWVNLYSNDDFESGYIQLSSGSAFSSSTSALTATLTTAGTYYLKINQGDTATNLTFDLLVSVAPPEWAQTASISTSNKVGVLALDADGVPYVLYTETDTTYEYKLSVKKEGASGWNAVGSPLFSNAVNSTCGMAMDISSTGKVAVAYGGGTSSFNKNLQIFEYDGSSWSQLGGDILTSTELIDGFDVQLEYASDGTLYVFCASKSSGKELYVRKWSTASSEWLKVGNETESYAAKNESASWYDFYAMGLNESGNPVLALRSFDGITVKVANGGEWGSMALDTVPSGAQLAYAEGTLMSIEQSTDAGNPVVIKAWLQDTWQQLGSTLSNVTNYKQKTLVSGADGSLIFAHWDSATFNFVLKIWNEGSSAWESYPTLATPVMDNAFSLAVSASGKMYLGFFTSDVTSPFKVYSYTPAE